MQSTMIVSIVWSKCDIWSYRKQVFRSFVYHQNSFLPKTGIVTKEEQRKNKCTLITNKIAGAGKKLQTNAYGWKIGVLLVVRYVHYILSLEQIFWNLGRSFLLCNLIRFVQIFTFREMKYHDKVLPWNLSKCRVFSCFFSFDWDFHETRSNSQYRTFRYKKEREKEEKPTGKLIKKISKMKNAYLF